MNDSSLLEQQLSSREIFNGVLLHVFSDEVLLPNGNHGVREYIKHLGAACVVPLTENGEVLMERQFRYPLRRVLWEIPAGKLDSPREDPLNAARRELLEETGVSAKEMVYLGSFYPTCAYSDEVIHMYLATGLSFGDTSLDEDEFINVEKVPLKKLVEEIMAGKIADGKTQAALLKTYIYLQNNTF